MSEPQSSALTEAEARDLHARLLAGDADAPPDLARAYLDRLTDWLLKRNPRLDPNDCATAAEDAIMALIKNPASYKPERQALEVYLRISARSDLTNLLERERRHTKRQATWEAVELSPAMRKYVRDEQADPALIVGREEDEWEHFSPPTIPDSVRVRLTPREEKVLELMDRKERKTALFAEILGIAHLSQTEQKREVKRVKDRLNKRRERAGYRHD